MICLKAIASILSQISFFFLLTGNLWATPEQNWTFTQSWYRPDKGDSLKTIKRELLYSSFDKAISKELKSKGKDPVIFYKNFEEKFNEAIKEEENSFKLKIGLTEDTKSKNKEELQHRLKLFRFNKKVKFGDLYRSVVSYQIQKQWQDDKERTIQRMKAKIKVDIPSLFIAYAMIMEQKNEGTPVVSSEVNSQETLYVRLNYQTEGFNWEDLDFSNEEEFHNSLVDAWIKWLRREFERKNNSMVVLKHAELLDEKMKENDALLDMHVRISKDILEKSFQRYVFKLSVDFSVLSSDYRLLYEGKLQNTKKEITQILPSRVPNLLANSLYRIPLNEFVFISPSIDKAKQQDQKDHIIVNSFKNLKQVNDFMNLLNSYGAELKLKSEITSVTSKEIILDLFYRGEQGRLLKIIEFISQNGFPLKIQSREFPLTLSF